MIKLPIDRSDLAAMQVFAASVRHMTDDEIRASLVWFWDRGMSEIQYRKRWPWWELDKCD